MGHINFRQIQTIYHIFKAQLSGVVVFPVPYYRNLISTTRDLSALYLHSFCVV
jgi:hypothetical protein